MSCPSKGLPMWRFDSIRFLVLEPGSRPVPIRERVKALPPGANHDIIQIIGTHSAVWQMTARVTPNARQSLYNRYQADTIGTLIDDHSTNHGNYMIDQYKETEVEHTAQHYNLDITFIARPV